MIRESREIVYWRYISWLFGILVWGLGAGGYSLLAQDLNWRSPQSSLSEQVLLQNNDDVNLVPVQGREVEAADFSSESVGGLSRRDIHDANSAVTLESDWDKPEFAQPAFDNQEAETKVELFGKEKKGRKKRLGMGSDRAPFRYRVQWVPNESVVGQGTGLDMFENDLSAGFPLLLSEPHTVILSGGARYLQMNTSAMFPDSGRPVPNELWSIRVGKSYIHRFANEWTAGVNVNFGSASDQPFGDLRNYNFGAVAFVTMPYRERDAWNFALVYMPMSQIPFPIPSVAYQWNPSDDLGINFGLPFQVHYSPNESWDFEFSYMLLTTVRAKSAFHWNEQWNSYVLFDWENQSWFLDDRAEDQERLFLYEKRLSAGLQHRFKNSFTIDLVTGFVFDRFFFNGDGFEDRRYDRVDIQSGAFIAIEAAWRF